MSEFFFCVRVLHLPGHQRREFWEINGAVSVGIHSVDHVLQLSLCRILIEDRLTVPNSLVVKVSSPSLSKEEKASLNSAVFCDSFNTAFFVLNNLLLFLSHLPLPSAMETPRLPLVRQLLFLQLPGTAELCSASPPCCTHMTF